MLDALVRSLPLRPNRFTRSLVAGVYGATMTMRAYPGSGPRAHGAAIERLARRARKGGPDAVAALEELCEREPEAARSIVAYLLSNERGDIDVRAFALHCAVVHSWLPDRLREVTDRQAGAVLVRLVARTAEHPAASELIDADTRQWLSDSVPVGRLEWLSRFWADRGVTEAIDEWRRYVRLYSGAAAAALTDLDAVCLRPPDDLVSRLATTAWFSSWRLAELGMGYNNTRPPRLHEAVAWLSWVRAEFGRVLSAEAPASG